MSRSVIEVLKDTTIAHPPKWLAKNLHYATIMGSVAYGVSSDTSDMDVYGFCMPPKEVVFPHLAGVIHGFSTQVQTFDVWQQHRVVDQGAAQNYDFAIYSIVKFFRLCMDNNPNMIDSLFTPPRCVLHTTGIGQRVREYRREFLHKGSYHKFKGYAFAQMGKIATKANAENQKRQADIEKYGFDTKFAYHVLRLGMECEQILEEGDLDIERNREVLKSVRRGEWTLERIKDWFDQKERHLDDLYQKSTLRRCPDEEKIRQLLLDCIEEHYGTVSQSVARGNSIEGLLRDIGALVEKYGKSHDDQP